MIDIHWLFVLTVLLLAFELLVLRLEYSSPGFIFTASFVICSGCSIYLAEDWNIEKIQYKTFSIIILSIILFLAINEIFRFYAKIIKTKTIIQNKYQEKHPIIISYSVIYATIGLGIICIIWGSYYILRYLYNGNWNAVMAMYKNILNTAPESLGIGKKLLNQFNKILVALNYILLFAYNYNASCIVISKRIKGLYIISFIEFMIFRLLLTGGRQSVLFFILAWFTASIICKTFKENKKEIKKANQRYVLLLLTAIVIIFPLFYFAGRFVGRKESDILYAATGYLTTGLYGLEWEIGNNYASNYWGEISFPGLYPLLKFFGIMPSSLQSQAFLPFFYHGNTVSILGRWYWDFGTAGVFIMIVLTASLFSYIYYYKILYAKDGHKRNISIIIYCYLVHILYFAGYDDFVMNVLSINFIITILLIYLFYRLLIIKRIKVFLKKSRRL